jgi:hypothetical protein
MVRHRGGRRKEQPLETPDIPRQAGCASPTEGIVSNPNHCDFHVADRNPRRDRRLALP